MLNYKDNTKIGTATVTITGKGNYSGSKTVTFKIVKRDISKLTIGTIGNQNYTGKAIKPAVSIKNGSVALKQDTDYTLSYKNNKKKGTATVTITGKGNYIGSVTKNFVIK